MDGLWDSPALKRPSSKANDEAVRERKRSMRLPEENVLYFIERYSPKLEPWQRDILRIVRNIAQYFYPQQQTKLMNEGCASFVHFHIMNRLHETGRIDDGAMLEILHNHTNVLNQPDFDDPRFAGINPYALGFAMMQDIRRICEDPSEEDRGWFPSYAGSGDWRAVLKDAWANYRDESFIQQFLSPQVIRRFKMFALTDQAEEPYYTVAGIHDEAGYVDVRDALARSYDLSLTQPDIQVSDVDLVGDRVLRLRRTEHDGISLEERDREATLSHIERLWGHSVVLEDA